MGHGEESKEQHQLVTYWSFVTILLLILAAAASLLFGAVYGDHSAESVIGKLSLALIIAGVAGYTAGIARHHRDRSAAARKQELEMNSFDTFIAPLGPKDRNDLRSTIIWRFLGPDNEPQSPDSEPRPRHRLRELLHLRRENRGHASVPKAEADGA